MMVGNLAGTPLVHLKTTKTTSMVVVYQMYHVLYIVDAVAMIILILAYAATLCFDKGAEPRTSIAIDGIDIKVKDVVNPVSGDGSGGQAVAEPLNQ